MEQMVRGLKQRTIKPILDHSRQKRTFFNTQRTKNGTIQSILIQDIELYRQ